MEPAYVRNTIKKVWKPGGILNRLNLLTEQRTYIDNVNGKVYYRTREHLEPRSNNMPKEVNENFEPLIQPFSPMPSTPTDIPLVSSAKPSTPVKAETSVSQPKSATPVKATVKEIVSYQ